MGGCCGGAKPKGDENARRPEQLEKKKDPADGEDPKTEEQPKDGGDSGPAQADVAKPSGQAEGDAGD